jgi:hypothetical protein
VPSPASFARVSHPPGRLAPLGPVLLAVLLGGLVSAVPASAQRLVSWRSMAQRPIAAPPATPPPATAPPATASPATHPPVAPPVEPSVAFRYTASQLDCAVFHEHSTGELQSQTGARRRRETVGRNGLLRFRARPRGDAIALEAWYDSLAVSREGPEASLTPDTDGLLGGRYRGTLTAMGGYAPEARPFVPDDVAEVADLAGALDDLLPPLPPVPLAPGQSWGTGTSLELRRLADSSAGSRSVLRLTLRARTESGLAAVRSDTLQLPAREVSVEEGRLDWDPAVGLIRRVRHIVVETSVPAGGPLKLPLQSRLEQTVTLTRGRRACPAGS